MSIKPLIVTGAALIAILPGCTTAKNPEKKPNIILIMSDDMGYSDLGCYGGEINTPSLDQLAQNGIRFTQFYNSARCCPTRASLLTGLHPHQTGIGHMTNPPYSNRHDYGLPEYQGYLNNKCVTLAEVLKEAGYSTLMTGKWHLGLNFENWPLQRGFDKFYGLLPGASNFFKPVYPRGITLMNDTITITDKDYYTTDAFTEYAIKFIDESLTENEDKPFFLYLSYTAPHWPIQAPAEDIEKYRGRYINGWTALRNERYSRMIKMGLIDPSWPLTDQDSRDWDSLDDEKKDEMDFRMAIYAAMVDRMDQNIGKLVDYLTANNQLENTIIIFLNDNGACAEFHELGSGPASRLGTKEGDILSYGRAWANASNTPYREYKHWVHEGGIGTPFIVHWPKGISSKNNGQLIHHYSYLPDVMATFVDVSGANYPEQFNGNRISPLQGKSFLPLLKGRDEPIHSGPIFFEHEGNKAVRQGKYKLVSKWEENQEYNWELFDMEKDRSEMNDLSEKMPELVSEMETLWKEWAESINVKSWTEINEIRRNLN